MNQQSDPDRSIGPYRLLHKIGEGGFGEIFAAEQTHPIRRRVALKLIKLGMDSRAVLARFDVERQALTLMDHPGIARILDVGEAEDGRPFFVMDLIRGASITEYCQQNTSSIRERVALLALVCDAVQHAHRKGVIHRDVKPSNILVATESGQSVPRVIDFGIAKALHGSLVDGTVMTTEGQWIGTPEYMSPEQVSGEADVDTTTDVYSLGAVLYELLTDSAPFDGESLRKAGAEAMARTIREVDPPKPSARIHGAGLRSARSTSGMGEIPGELDWITLKAMEKSPARRYDSAAALGRDLQRYLDDDPVEAAPPGAAYHLRKFTRRHRLGVGLAAMAVLVLVAFGGTMGVQAGRIANERDRANRERVGAERVTEFLSEMLGTVQPELLGQSLWRDLRERVRDAYRSDGASDPEIRRALATLDSSLVGVNPTDVALRLIDREVLSRAGETIEMELGDEPLIAARLRNTFGNTYRDLGLFDQAEPYIRRSLEQRTELLGDDHPETFLALNSLTVLLQKQGRLDEAEKLGRETLGRAQSALGRDHSLTLGAWTDLGMLLRRQGRLDEAIVVQREALAEHRRVLGDEHRETVTAMLNLGWGLHEAGEFQEGERFTRDAVECGRRRFGGDDVITLTAMNNLGNILARNGDFEEAEALLRETLAAARRIQGNDHPGVFTALINLGAVLDTAGKLEEAEPFYREAVEGLSRTLGPDHASTLAAVNNLGFLLKAQGRYVDAEPYLEQTLQNTRRTLGGDHVQTLVAMANLSDLYIRQGSPERAEPLMEMAVDGAARALPEGHWLLGVFLQRYGISLRDQDRFASAEESLLQSYDILAAALGDDHERSATSATAIAELYERWGRNDAAAGWTAKAGEAPSDESVPTQ